MAELKKKKYIAVNGLNLNCTDKNPAGVRVEPGESVPDTVKVETLKDLLANGDIEEGE